MNRKKDTWSIQTAVIKSKSKINFNPAYQREYEAKDVPAWQSKLIKSILLDRDLPKFYLRVENFLNIHKPVGNREPLWKKPYECVDGQQRLRTILDFVMGEVKLPQRCDVWYEGKIHELGGMNYFEVEAYDDGLLLNDLFLNYDLDVTYVEGGDDEMADLFFDLNDLNAMNPQQKRNCIISDIAVFIRDTARNPENKTDIKHSLFDIVDDVKRDGSYLGFKSKKMAFDHLLAEMCCYETYGTTKGIGNTELNKLYREVIFKKSFPYKDNVKVNLDCVYGILKNQDYTPSANKNVITNLYMVINYINNTYSKVKFDYNKFADWFFKTHGDLKTLTTQMKIDKLYETPYSADTRVGKDKDAVTRRINYFIDELNDIKLIDAGIIIRDKQRVLNDTDTLSLYIKSKKKCQACDTSLKLGEVVKGHKIAWSKGGKSIKDNTVILCRTCNSKQGDMNFDEFKKLEAFV